MPKPDVIGELSAFSWRELEFPTTRFSVALAHDLVEHKYWGRDGADVEATGRAPLRIRANIPFVNHIFPGPGEKWLQGKLYPFVFNAFLKVFADRSSDVLNHPELGSIRCKPSNLSVEWSGKDTRDGVLVDAEWVETLDVVGEGFEVSFRDSQIGNINAASNLESQKLDVAALLPPAEQTDFWSVVLSTDLRDVANAITSIGGRAGAAAYTLNGKLSSLEYMADRIERSLDATNSPLTWPARQSCSRMRDGAQRARTNGNHEGRTILHHTTKRALTLAGVSVSIPGAQVGDLLRLNPRLASSPIIPAGTIVRHFAA